MDSNQKLKILEQRVMAIREAWHLLPIDHMADIAMDDLNDCIEHAINTVTGWSD